MTRDGDLLVERRIDEHVGFALVIEQDRAGVDRGMDRRRVPAGKVFADLCFDEIGIEVAHHDHRRVLGAVDALVERPQLLAGRRPQRLDGADRQAMDEARARIEEGDAVEVVAQLVGVAHPLLRQHDAFLALDCRRIEAQFASRLAHDHQRGVEQAGVVARQVEPVERDVVIGTRVGIRPESQPFALEQADHLALGNAGRAVERHVFDEVRVAELLIGLGERARIHPELHHRRALGRRVRPDHVAHSVVEPAEAVGGIGRQVALVERPFVMRLHRGRLGQGRQPEREKEGRQQGTKDHRPLCGRSGLNGQWPVEAGLADLEQRLVIAGLARQLSWVPHNGPTTRPGPRREVRRPGTGRRNQATFRRNTKHLAARDANLTSGGRGVAGWNCACSLPMP